jgi:hypothetical protein
VRITTLFFVVPNEYVTGGAAGAVFPFRSEGLYFTPMMKFSPVSGVSVDAQPVGLAALERTFDNLA